MTKTCTNCQKPFTQIGSGAPSFCPACKDVGEGKKRCTRCKAVKDLGEFHVVNGKRRGHCKACEAAYFQGNGHVHAKRRRQEHPERDFQQTMKSQNIQCTWEQYQALLTSQGGVCAICHKPEVMRRKDTLVKLAVDHDHATGKVRGLLCSRCNLTIGKMEENPDLLRNAVFYLEQHRC